MPLLFDTHMQKYDNAIIKELGEIYKNITSSFTIRFVSAVHVLQVGMVAIPSLRFCVQQHVAKYKKNDF